MRTLNAMGALAAVAALSLGPAAAQEAFDACQVFTPEDAEAAMGTTISVVTEPVNPKVKPKPPPKVIPICSYKGYKEGKPVEAKAHFRFGKTDAEAQKAFEEHRMQVQTKPLLISGAEAFWSNKTGQMNLRKGRTWVTLSVGPEKLSERDVDQAKALAELLVKKL